MASCRYGEHARALASDATNDRTFPVSTIPYEDNQYSVSVRACPTETRTLHLSARERSLTATFFDFSRASKSFTTMSPAGAASGTLYAEGKALPCSSVALPENGIGKWDEGGAIDVPGEKSDVRS